MKQQLYYLDSRLSVLEQFIGFDENPNAVLTPNRYNEKIQEVVSKLPKDIQNKFEKIKKTVNTYDKVVDEHLTTDKVQTIKEEAQQIIQIAQLLEDIEDLTKYLNFQPLVNLKNKSKDLAMLATCSTLEVGQVNGPLKVLEFKNEDLEELNLVRRNKFQQLALLNNSIVQYFNNKIRAIHNRLTQLETRA